MKPLKSLICCLAAALIFSAVFSAKSGIHARAETARYARADARDIYFYKEKELTHPLFTIPYTYCVEILGTDGDLYFVKYAEDAEPYKALYGYCRMSDKLTVVDVPPANIYLNMYVPVTYHPEMPDGSLSSLGDIQVSAAFYGTFYSKESTARSYVYYDGNFGYVNGANDNYPLNEIVVDTFHEQSAGKGKKSNTKLITVLVLSGLAATTLIVLYLTGRRRYFKP